MDEAGGLLWVQTSTRGQGWRDHSTRRVDGARPRWVAMHVVARVGTGGCEDIEQAPSSAL